MTQIDIHRTFHPVGQGAFYTEVFTCIDGERFVMVYDCGSKTSENDMDVDLDSQIEAFIKCLGHYPVIDALFLSHFHDDNINGLDKLLNAVTVKQTIIPMLTLPALTLTRVQNFLTIKDEETRRRIDEEIQDLYLNSNPSDIFGSIYVVGIDDERPLEEREKENRYPQRLGNGKVIPNGKKWCFTPFWEYVPFNSVSAFDQRAIDFMDGLIQIPGALVNGELNVEGLIRGCRTKVRDLYKKVMKNANDNLYTLVVESTPVQGVHPAPDERLSKCLYMGDFDCGDNGKWNRFQQVYDINVIGTIQVPHHGSKENWHEDLLRGKERKYVISAGTTNTYHHPDYWVIDSMRERGHSTAVVSEKDRTMFEEFFFLK